VVEEERAEVGVLAFAEKFPHVGVREGRKGREFELEKMVLVWAVEDCMLGV